MTTENVLFALIGLALAMTTRGIFVLTSVFHGLKYLYNSTEEDKGRLLVLKRQTGEGLILLVLIAGLALTLFLFAHEGVM
jgi:hypothetical protein